MSETPDPTQPPSRPGPAVPPPFGPYARPVESFGPAAPRVEAAPAASGPSEFAPVSAIDRFKAPARRWVWPVGLVIAALVLGTTVWLATAPPPSPSASTSPTAQASPPPSAASGQPYVMPKDNKSTGTWEVLDHTWDPSGVTVKVRITALSGTTTYSFTSFPLGSAQDVPPTEGTAPSPELTTGQLGAGQEAIGYLRFDVPRSELRIVLMTRLGSPISQLAVAP